MEWYHTLILLIGLLVLLMLTGTPIAICFLLINVAGFFILFGDKGPQQLILSMYSSLATFVLIPVPLFVLMGELLFLSGMGGQIIGILDKWLGRLPGRLSLLAVMAGTLFASLTGASAASIAMMGSVLIPEMDKQGYKKEMSIGAIMGAGGLAVLIPPSSLAVLVGSISEISVGKILIAIIVPGVMLAFIYVLYIIIRCTLQPDLAPSYVVNPTPMSEKLKDFVKYVLPLGLVIFLVIGVIFLGLATPSEAAATGTIGTLIVLIIYKRMNWDVIKKATIETLKITGMITLIIAGAVAFSQILSFTRATRGLTTLVIGLTFHPIIIVIIMQIILLIMGCFLSLMGTMMITLPVFVPIITNLGLNPVWFAAIYLLNMEMSFITPPFGMSLYVMKGVSRDTSMMQIIRATMPFFFLQLLALALMIAFPQICLWLPSRM